MSCKAGNPTLLQSPRHDRFAEHRAFAAQSLVVGTGGRHGGADPVAVPALGLVVRGLAAFTVLPLVTLLQIGVGLGLGMTALAALVLWQSGALGEG